MNQRPVARVGRLFLAIESELLEIAATRVDCSKFLASGAADLEIVRCTSLGSLKQPFVNSPAREGAVELVGRELRLLVPDDAYAAESGLRIAYQILIARQGGLLVHAASTAFSPRTIVAVGASTSGKSTLAGLCRGAGGQLLSDEMTALFPDGTVYGTPFRSSDPTPGHPGPAKLGLLVLLEKSDHEELVDIAPEKALPRILEQVYRGYDGGELTPARILERVAGFMNVCPPKVLRFRKHPDAGVFVRNYLESLG